MIILIEYSAMHFKWSFLVHGQQLLKIKGVLLKIYMI